jgi:hypothetical protein
MSGSHDTRARLSRRGLLGAGAALAAGGYGLYPRPVLADIPDQFDGTTFQLTAPDPSPKHGGVLRMGITNRVPHFDLHQSGTYNNLGSMGCLFDNLIRRDPRDGGKTVIPDLAHSWDIAKDRKTYTFYLRKGVQFHDGAELTSDDVKATFDRIAAPGGQHSAQHPVQGGGRGKRARQIHHRVQAVRATPACLHHGGDRQRLERHRAQEDAGGQQLQPAQGGVVPGHRAIQDRQAGRERDLGGGEEQGLLEQRPAIS